MKELLPLYAFFLVPIWAKCTKIYNKGTPSLMCILNFHLVPNVPKFFNISRLFSANYSYFIFFSNVMLFYVTVNFSPCTVILCQLPPPPPQTSVVKTLPLHTPLGLVLFSPNEFPIPFVCTNQFLFSFNMQLALHTIFQLCSFISVCIFQLHHHHTKTGTQPPQTSSIV